MRVAIELDEDDIKEAIIEFVRIEQGMEVIPRNIYLERTQSANGAPGPMRAVAYGPRKCEDAEEIK